MAIDPRRRPIMQDIGPDPEIRADLFTRLRRLTIGSTFLIVVLLIALATLKMSVYNIDAGHVGVVKRFGDVVSISDPGLHFKIPYADSVDEIETRERAFTMTLEAASRDPMELPIIVTVNWLVKRDHVRELYVSYGSLAQFETRIIQPRLPDAIKGIVSAYTVNELLTKRTEFRDHGLKALIRQMPDDIQVTGFSIVNIGFPAAYTKQIQDKQVAREAAETEKFVLDKQKFTAQQKTQSAEAQRDADKALADGKAYSIEVEGKAIAAAISSRGEALAKNPLVIQFESVTRWSGQFPTTFMGGDAAAHTMWNLSSAPAAPTAK